MFKIPNNATLSETYSYAMEITAQEEADAWFEALVNRNMKTTKASRQHAEQTERSNLGYWAGYYDEDTRRRVEKLFRCEHPVFGSIEKNGPPTPEAAFEAGKRFGKRIGTEWKKKHVS